MIETNFSGATGDGDTISPLLDRDYERGYLSISFYSDESLTNIVTPSAGVVDIVASEDGDIYGTISEGASVDASTIGPSSQYARPNWSGQVKYLKVSLSGVVGANYFKCSVFSYRSSGG